MSPQGICIAIALAILGIIGDVSRFPTIGAFRGFFGFIPKKNQSSGWDQKGLRIHKAVQKSSQEIYVSGSRDSQAI